MLHITHYFYLKSVQTVIY